MRKVLTFFWILLSIFACEKADINSLQNPPSLGGVSSGDLTSTITLGGSKNDVTNSVFATSDNGYIVAGTTQSRDGDIIGKTNTSFDFWVVKFDENHNIEWSKTYGGSGDDRAQKVIQTSDNGFVIIGYSDLADGDVSSNNGLQDFWIIKLDSKGNLLWEKNYGFPGNDFGTNIKEGSDGSLYAVGVIDITASGGQGDSGKFQTEHAGGDYWVLKLSASGDLIWSRFFGGSFTDTAADLSLDNNGNILIIGGTDSEDSDITDNIGTYDFWAVKIDPNGTLIWQKNYGGTEIDEGRSVVKTSSGFLLVGDTRSSDKDVVNNNGGADIWTAHIDENGSLMSSQNFGGSGFDVPRSVIKTLDNNYIITGSSRSSDKDVSSNFGQNDVWVFKTNLQGSIIWETSVGGSNIDFAYQSAQLNNGTVIVVGESSSNDGDVSENKGFTDAFIIRID